MSVTLAAQVGDLDTLHQLLSAPDVDVCERAGDGSTALHQAAANGHIECALLLVKSGHPVNATTHTGQTPTYLAWRGGHSETVDRLKELGGTLNDNTPFDTKEYWDEQYTGITQASEWYSGWADLKHILQPLLPHDHSLPILEVGCGNSTLTVDMALHDGYSHLTSIDISDPVIQYCAKTFQHVPGVQFLTMDAFHTSFSDAQFAVVLDKGTIDAIICGADGANDVVRLCHEMNRILQPSGCFVIISCNPDLATLFAQINGWSWNVQTLTCQLQSDPASCFVCSKNPVSDTAAAAAVTVAPLVFSRPVATEGLPLPPPQQQQAMRCDMNESDFDRAQLDFEVPAGECRLCASRRRVRRKYFVYRVCKGRIE
eukprot:TRINITY_DN15668_c0_g1_i1.p1 TRINITY_DN15668_c0_g1~~TRINITY_DN15668_c0_g1_i1.p1  ORF type:complete len:371 (+),score=53.88 TRINITY_DN15668_c0_g1_i1:106-1218(+)